MPNAIGRVPQVSPRRPGIARSPRVATAFGVRQVGQDVVDAGEMAFSIGAQQDFIAPLRCGAFWPRIFPRVSPWAIFLASLRETRGILNSRNRVARSRRGDAAFGVHWVAEDVVDAGQVALAFGAEQDFMPPLRGGGSWLERFPRVSPWAIFLASLREARGILHPKYWDCCIFPSRCGFRRPSG